MGDKKRSALRSEQPIPVAGAEVFRGKHRGATRLLTTFKCQFRNPTSGEICGREYTSAVTSPSASCGCKRSYQSRLNAVKARAASIEAAEKRARDIVEGGK